MRDCGAWRRVAPVLIPAGISLSGKASQNINLLFVSGLYDCLDVGMGFERKKGRENRPGSHLRRSDQMIMIKLYSAGSVPLFVNFRLNEQHKEYAEEKNTLIVGEMGELGLGFKMLQQAEKRWIGIYAPEKVLQLFAGVKLSMACRPT
jgi:hypothetical protein